MTTLKPLLLVGCAILTFTTACEQTTREKLGLVKTAPDEFSVITRAPLSVPPDFSLRPPRPGMQRPMEVSTRDDARQTVFGQSDVTGARVQSSASVNDSDGFLGKIGANTIDPDIRYELDTAEGTDNRTTAEKLLFMSPSSDEGETLNPQEERDRLKSEGVIIERRTEDIIAP